MTEWHTWDEVSSELGDVLGSAEERAERVEQLRRGLVLRRLVEQRKRGAWAAPGRRWLSGWACRRPGLAISSTGRSRQFGAACPEHPDAIGGRLEMTAVFDGRDRVARGGLGLASRLAHLAL